MLRKIRASQLLLLPRTVMDAAHEMWATEQTDLLTVQMTVQAVMACITIWRRAAA